VAEYEYRDTAVIHVQLQYCLNDHLRSSGLKVLCLAASIAYFKGKC
jgi:hypothetical protein